MVLPCCLSELFARSVPPAAGYRSRRSRSGGSVNRKHVQPVVKIGAEFPLLHHLSQVLIGRRDDPHVDLKGVAAAQALELLFLKGAEKFRLQFQREIADLIQKQSAAVRGLKAPDGLQSRRP